MKVVTRNRGTSINLNEGICCDGLGIGGFSTELNFDSDQDIYLNATGQSIAFTIGANNTNGIGIYLRLNKPTSVTFPASFEADTGSSTLDSTKLNVYLLLFFTNWNGYGQDHVIYKNSLYTAL